MGAADYRGRKTVPRSERGEDRLIGADLELHGLFDGVDDDTRYRITVGAFLDLFPEVGAPPALKAA